jgi:hypothetical protein
MIRFSLTCVHDHVFEGWFRNNSDFDEQKQKSLISCPTCNSLTVDKSLMTPALATTHVHAEKAERENRGSVTLSHGQNQEEIMQQMRILAQKLKEGAEYVGDRFALEARKIHDGETDARGIYGEATLDEMQSLADDGIDFMPVPAFPDDYN